MSRDEGPREAAAVAAVLRAQGASAWEPRVVAQLLEFSYRHVAEVLQEAQQYAAHRTREAPGAAAITLADVRLAAQGALTHTFTEPLGGDELARIVRPLNEAPLPPVTSRPGLVLPPEGTLLAQAFQVRAACAASQRQLTRRVQVLPAPRAPQPQTAVATAQQPAALQQVVEGAQAAARPLAAAAKRKRIPGLGEAADEE